MQKTVTVFLALAFSTSAAPVLADPGKDESGHGRGNYKEEYWDGNCKVERKYKNGEYKEERKCNGVPTQSRGSQRDEGDTVVVRPPSVVLEAPSVVLKPPRVTIE